MTMIPDEDENRIQQDYFLLYPHEVKTYVLIVPSMLKLESKLSEFIFRSPLIRIWAIAIVMFTLFRITQRKCANPRESANRLVYIPFNTFGLSFGSTSVTGVKSRSELITVFFLSVFGMLAGLLFSGLLFEELTTTESIPQITTLSDLSMYPNIQIIYSPGIARQTLLHDTNMYLPMPIFIFLYYTRFFFVKYFHQNSSRWSYRSIGNSKTHNTF